MLSCPAHCHPAHGRPTDPPWDALALAVAGVTGRPLASTTQSEVGYWAVYGTHAVTHPAMYLSPGGGQLCPSEGATAPEPVPIPVLGAIDALYQNIFISRVGTGLISGPKVGQRLHPHLTPPASIEPQRRSRRTPVCSPSVSSDLLQVGAARRHRNLCRQSDGQNPGLWSSRWTVPGWCRGPWLLHRWVWVCGPPEAHPARQGAPLLPQRRLVWFAAPRSPHLQPLAPLLTQIPIRGLLAAGARCCVHAGVAPRRQPKSKVRRDCIPPVHPSACQSPLHAASSLHRNVPTCIGTTPRRQFPIACTQGQ